jgi:S1-C subfamily serine protease
MFSRHIPKTLPLLLEVTLIVLGFSMRLANGGVTLTGVSERGGDTNQIGGATIENLTPDISEELGLPPTMRGVVVLGVDPYSPAGKSGMLPGDVIVAVNNTSVESVTELKDTVWRMGLTPVIFSVIREGIGYIFTFPV